MVETTKMDKHIVEFQFWVQVEWTRVLGRICGGIYQEKKFIRVTFYTFPLTWSSFLCESIRTSNLEKKIFGGTC